MPMVRPQPSAPAGKKRAHPESYQITYPLGLSMTLRSDMVIFVLLPPLRYNAQGYSI